MASRFSSHHKQNHSCPHGATYQAKKFRHLGWEYRLSHLNAQLAVWQYFRLNQGSYFTSADADVLTILSGQASVAIENALLYQQTQHRAHQLETLNKLTAAMTASLDLTEVLTQVCNSVAQVGGSQKSAIFLLNPGGETVSLAHTHGLDENFQQRNAVFSITNSRRARCLQTGKPMVIPDIQNSSMSVDLVLHFRADKIQAFADFPLITPDGQIGFLSVYFTEKHDFPTRRGWIVANFRKPGCSGSG